MPSLLDPDGAIAADYGIEGFPSEVFIDGEGNVVSTQLGALSAADLWATVAKMTPATTATSRAPTTSTASTATSLPTTSTSAKAPTTTAPALTITTTVSQATTSLPPASTSTSPATTAISTGGGGGGGVGAGGGPADALDSEGRFSGVVIALIVVLVVVIVAAAALMIVSRIDRKPRPEAHQGGAGTPDDGQRAPREDE